MITLTCFVYPPPVFAQISPSTLEVNLGPFPFDAYSESVLNNGYFPSCPANVSVRECVRRFISTGSNNYVGQGVTGVRFQFGLRGGGNSTPFDANGNISATWIANVGTFFSDLRGWGIQRVTPSPVLWESWSGPMQQGVSQYRNVPGCPTGQENLWWFPWLPFGMDVTTDPQNPVGAPDTTGANQAYYCSPRNPIFWGWDKLIGANGLVDQVLARAQAAAIQVSEFDLQNEVNIRSFTVMARLIWDPTENRAVTDEISQRMVNHGFVARRAIPSVGTDMPDTGDADNGGRCASVYGDSAYLMLTSELMAAYGGAKFGFPPGDTLTVPHNLPCYNTASSCGPPVKTPAWQQCATAGMITLPAGSLHNTPTIIDMHAGICIVDTTPNHACTSTDTTTIARSFYSDVWGFLQYRGMTGSLAMFGETNTGQPAGCDSQPQSTALQNVAGYRSSSLFTGDAGNVVLRPWENSRSACYQTPAPIGGPGNPYRLY